MKASAMGKKQQLVNELHRTARKNFKRRRVIIIGYDDTWQADLVEMGAYSNVNNGFRYLLTIIDTFSKYAWTIPIKSKTGYDVTNAMQSVLKGVRKPKNLQTDDGTDFFNKTFRTLMAKYKINHYSTYSSLKASIVERFNRTLKNKMWKAFSMNGNYEWVKIIMKILSDYNNCYHRTIKMKPIHVCKENEKQLLSTVYNYKITGGSAKFCVGENVRISKYKHIFEKGYTPNWTTEIFKIRKIQSTNPVTYLLKDYQNQPISGGFYELELHKASSSDLYLVEKILKTKDQKIFVKWLGFPDNHNSWINKNAVL